MLIRHKSKIKLIELQIETIFDFDDTDDLLAFLHGFINRFFKIVLHVKIFR